MANVEHGVTVRKSLLVLVLAAGAVSTSSCANRPLPTQPTVVAPIPAILQLEGEDGSSNGQVRRRSRASGGQTLHLAPGEDLVWAFAVPSSPATFAVSVTYSNGREGPNELLVFRIDGAVVTSFVNRDSGDAVEGWNTFITDPITTARLGSALHTLTIESSGGDGCVEIDKVTLVPSQGA